MRRRVLHALLGVSLVAAVLAAPQATVGAQGGWNGFTATAAPDTVETTGMEPAPGWDVATTEDLGGAGRDVWINNHAFRAEALQDFDSNGANPVSATRLLTADSHGTAFTDIDGDGDDDLVEVRARDNDSGLSRNDDGTLTVIAAASGIEDTRGRGRAVLSTDIDNDGNMDLFLANLDRTSLDCDDGDSDMDPMTPDCFDGGPADAAAESGLYTGDGDFTFNAVADGGDALEDGDIVFLNQTSTGPNMDQVVVTSNNFAVAINSLSTGAAALTAAPIGSGALKSPVGVGKNASNIRDISFGDFNGDLVPDYVAARQDNNLEGMLEGSLPLVFGELEFKDGGINDGNPAALSAIGGGDALVDNCRTVAAGDFDNDGNLDVFAGCTFDDVNGGAGQNQNAVLLGDGTGGFTVEALTATTNATAVASSVTDLNNDGFLDVVVVNGYEAETGPDTIFNNAGGTNNYLMVDLANSGNPDAMGAQVFVGTDKWQARETAHRYHRGQNMKTLHFGLGTETIIDDVQVVWPNGDIESCTVEGGVNQRVTITKGSASCETISGSALASKLAAPPTQIEPGPFCRGVQVTVDISMGDVPTNGNDVILGTEGDDTIDALAGVDMICGLGGDDTIRGGDGNDRIFGDDGNDLLFGDGGRDVIQGGAGDDRVEGGLRNDRISGNGGKDELLGGNGRDRVDGQGGADIVNGGGGNDRLLGGGGIDLINGKVGTDRCIEGETVLNCELDEL